MCRETVFATRNDPCYQAALRVIESWRQDLVTHPREDMPGSVPCAAYTATQAKREAWLRVEAENRRGFTGR